MSCWAFAHITHFSRILPCFWWIICRLYSNCISILLASSVAAWQRAPSLWSESCQVRLLSITFSLQVAIQIEIFTQVEGILMYDLNQIPYDYTVEVRNRFKGLDLIDRVPDELWNEVHDIVQETGIKTIPMEKKCKKQNGCLGRHLHIWGYWYFSQQSWFHLVLLPAQHFSWCTLHIS